MEQATIFDHVENKADLLGDLFVQDIRVVYEGFPLVDEILLEELGRNDHLSKHGCKLHDLVPVVGQEILLEPFGLKSCKRQKYVVLLLGG